MSPPLQRLLALLATGRVANLPTVWTNVLAGSLLASPSLGIALSGFGLDLADFVLSCLLASCFYVGGCFLGDASDARWDAEHRPDRPIPSGILSSTRVAFAGYALLTAGWFGGCVFDAMLWAVHTPAEVMPALKSVTPDSAGLLLYGLNYERAVLSTFLALSILLYARLHKRVGTGAPILMALCRGLLVLWAGSLSGSWFGGNPDEAAALLNRLLPYALCIFTYTIVLSMVARNESDPDVKLPPLLLQLLFLFPPVGVALFLGLRDEWNGSETYLPLATALTAFLAWNLRNRVILLRSVPAFVSGALAGLCLLDALFAASLGWPPVLMCLGLFLLALLLQRIAPAT